MDSSYGSHPDGRGRTGAIESVGKGGINFMSKKQKLVCKSSMEAEEIGLSDVLYQCYCDQGVFKSSGISTQQVNNFP